jgi:hypothetical protein
MAIDYLHRLLIRGSNGDVRAFRRQIYREYPRSIDDQNWIEIVPFCFKALYEMAPRACRIDPIAPGDPYELRAWPVRWIGHNQSEVRYQFQTRNLEIAGLIRVLSRSLPSLTFTLATLCIDDSSVEVYRFKGRSTQKWKFPQRRQDFHWNRARIKFGLAEEDDDEDGKVEDWADEQMLHEAMTHWNKNGGTAARSSPRSRYRWWNRRPLRDLATERQLGWFKHAVEIRSKTPHRKSRASAGLKRRKGRNYSKT